MAERYKVAIRVVSQKGYCGLHHKVGDEWILDGSTPAGICGGAYLVIGPRADVLMYGGSFPWEADPDATMIACPDAENPVVFELKRVR